MAVGGCALPLRRAALTLVAAVVAVVAAVTLAAPIHAEPVFPTLTSRITDEAGLIKPDDYTAIIEQLKALEAKSTDQVAVVTLKSLQGYPIEDFGYRLGRKWGIGQKDKDNGILLIVAPNERKVRIEVGRGLEPLMTDLMSKLIIENAILPEFRRGDYSAGIRAGVRDINDVLLGDAEEVKNRARQAEDKLDFFQIVLIIFWIVVILFVVFAVVQSINQQQQAVGTRGQRRRAGPVYAPTDSGGWGGGGWSSGGGGGGGWSGGGGDFGGGGSSGSW
jgi:uncharacterized protein